MSGNKVVKNLVIALGLIVCFFVVFWGTRNFKHWYTDVVLDNKEHFLSCTELPEKEFTERVFREHAKTVAEIEQINPGFIFVEVDATQCAGKADIVIYFASHKEREQIETILGDSFWGVPYRMYNR